MSNAFFNGGGSSIEGRIERLQILRPDGTIRESRNVNIHNTIVNGGLDNVLTIGGFPNNATTNNQQMNGSSSINNCCLQRYDSSLWLRMLWFLQLGTDTSDHITLYDDVSLVDPYINADQETYSQSHYIPASSNLNVRGTTHESYKEGDIHSTHRITSNSVRITEDNVTITEVGFFVGTNTTWESKAWNTQIFSVGDMFCRINLGTNKITLNTGERLVVTYALTEYAGMSTHTGINDIKLVDSNGDPIKYTDSDGNEHTIGAIARCWMGDGRYTQTGGTTVSRIPGAFKCILATEDCGYAVPLAGQSYDTIGNNGDYYGVYPASVYTTQWDCYVNSNVPFRRGARTNHTYYNNFRVCCDKNISRSTAQYNGKYQYNQGDAYGFPSINVTECTCGSHDMWSGQAANRVNTAGRCNDNNTNPTPNGNYTGFNVTGYSDLVGHATIKPYTRNTFYRDQEWVIPTYMPRYDTDYSSSFPNPLTVWNIYWLFIRSMIFKIGYFEDGYEGNIDHFTPCPIRKKAGQVFRCTLREHIGRHVGIAPTV